MSFIQIRGGPFLAIEHIVSIDVRLAVHYSTDRIVSIKTVLGDEYHRVYSKSQADDLISCLDENLYRIDDHGGLSA